MTPERWQEVEDLFHRGIDTGAGRPIDEDPAPVGRQIGAYRLLQEIGRGGMGSVYLAERADQQYEKRLAIKLVKRGMDSDSVLRRFRAERQILASMDHPNIAKLHDGGTTEDGRPYFVMELIEGEPIDEYAEAHALSIESRDRAPRSPRTLARSAHPLPAERRPLARHAIARYREPHRCGKTGPCHRGAGAL